MKCQRTKTQGTQRGNYGEKEAGTLGGKGHLHQGPTPLDQTWKNTIILHELNLCQHICYLTKARKSPYELQQLKKK